VAIAAAPRQLRLQRFDPAAVQPRLIDPGGVVVADLRTSAVPVAPALSMIARVRVWVFSARLPPKLERSAGMVWV